MINDHSPRPDQDAQDGEHIPSRGTPVSPCYRDGQLVSTAAPKWAAPPAFARGITGQCPACPPGSHWCFLSHMILVFEPGGGLAYRCEKHARDMPRPPRPIGGPVRIVVQSSPFARARFVSEPLPPDDPWAKRQRRHAVPYGCDGDPCTKPHRHPDVQPEPEPPAGGFLSRFFRGLT